MEEEYNPGKNFPTFFLPFKVGLHEGLNRGVSLTVDGYILPILTRLTIIKRRFLPGVRVNINFFCFITVVNHSYFVTGSTSRWKSVVMSG